MSRVDAAAAKPRSKQTGAADREAFAQVEKWMAIIREMGRDQDKAN